MNARIDLFLYEFKNLIFYESQIVIAGKTNGEYNNSILIQQNMVVFDRNEIGNQFWEKIGFTKRDDLVYRNQNIHELDRIDT